MRKRLLGALAGASFGLFIASIATWSGSIAHTRLTPLTESILYDSGDGRNKVVVIDGRIQWEHRSYTGPYVNIRTPPYRGISFLACWVYYVPGPNLQYRLFLAIHFWLTSLSSATVGIALYAVYRLRRLPSGACEFCGYDLRATPERCPECGTIPVARGTGIERLTDAGKLRAAPHHG